jgi:hypothetical protein
MWLKHILEAMMVDGKLMVYAKRLRKTSKPLDRRATRMVKSGLIYLRAATFAELGVEVRG